MHGRPGNLRLNILLCLVLAAAAVPANAVWQWMRGAVLTDFKDSDWELLKATARQVLNDKPDGEQVNWTNPETGNRGSIIALSTFTFEGKRCRKAAMRNLSAAGREGRASYNLCQQPDGTWIYLSESALHAATPSPP